MFNRTRADYGFAGLNQIRQLGNIVLTLDYDVFYPMIYDLKIDENVIKGFSSNKKCNLYPFKRGDILFNVGLQFMVLDKPSLTKFISYIDLDYYLNDTNFIAEHWLYSLKDKLNYEIENIPVEDEIYFFDDTKLDNQSPIEDLKFFIEKNDVIKSNVKLFFHGN